MSAKQKKDKQHLTARQLQSQKIAREKATRKWFRAVYRKVVIVVGAVVAVNVAVGSWWLWSSGAAARASNNMVVGFYRMTADAGFKLDTIYLEGRNRTKLEEVRAAIGARKGTPILRVAMDEMRARLEALEHVKEASVERALPGTLYVRIVEREPVAIWQHHGQLSLVDEEGHAMEGEDIAEYSYLPLVLGEDAPQHVSELVRLLAGEPDLVPRIRAVVRMGQRRWNIKFEGGVEVKLPEDGADAAWRKLAAMQREQRVLEREVVSIDMRARDRVFIKLTPAALRPKKQLAPAKET